MTGAVCPLSLPVEAAPEGVVTAYLHEPKRRRGRSVLLVPGAGGNLDSEATRSLAEVVTACGHRVVRSNLVHHEAGRRAPRAETAVAAYRDVLAAARAALDEDGPLVLGGRSYGGRVASMAVAEGTPAAGLLLSGYPLHPPGDPERLRVQHWPHIGVPCLFLQGDHDALCDLDLLSAHLRKLPRRPTVEVVTGANHELRVTGARSPDGAPRSPTDSVEALRPEICGWLAER